MAYVRRSLTAMVLFGALTMTTTACGSAGTAGSASQAPPMTDPAGPESEDNMTASPATDGTPITIEFDGGRVAGTLSDSSTARSLIDQLPLTLTFSDFGSQEKIADLPAPLSLEGVPRGDDADPLTIGYYAPGQALVLYYEHVGHHNGIVRIGMFEDLGTIRDREGDFEATMRVAG